MSEKIWYEDLRGFISNIEIIPLQSMSFEAKINATLRFFIILGLLLALLLQDYRYLLFGLVALTVSYPLYELEQRDKTVAETFLKKNDIFLEIKDETDIKDFVLTYILDDSKSEAVYNLMAGKTTTFKRDFLSQIATKEIKILSINGII